MSGSSLADQTRRNGVPFMVCLVTGPESENLENNPRLVGGWKKGTVITKEVFF